MVEKKSALFTCFIMGTLPIKNTTPQVLEISFHLLNVIRHGTSLISRQTHILFMKLNTASRHVNLIFSH